MTATDSYHYRCDMLLSLHCQSPYVSYYKQLAVDSGVHRDGQLEYVHSTRARTSGPSSSRARGSCTPGRSCIWGICGTCPKASVSMHEGRDRRTSEARARWKEGWLTRASYGGEERELDAVARVQHVAEQGHHHRASNCTGSCHHTTRGTERRTRTGSARTL